jgi:hypothetical protein
VEKLPQVLVTKTRKTQTVKAAARVQAATSPMTARRLLKRAKKAGLIATPQAPGSLD